MFKRFSRWSDNLISLRTNVSSVLARLYSRDALVLIPGAALMFLGSAIVVAPQLVTAAFALLLVLTGVGLCLICWKAAQLKRRFEKLLGNFEGQILIHRGGPQLREFFESGSEEKKVTFH